MKIQELIAAVTTKLAPLLAKKWTGELVIKLAVGFPMHVGLDPATERL